MLRVNVSFVIITVFLSTLVTAFNATNISDCPKLNPRDSVPDDINDLRIDDIKVFAALGDSIIAGFGAVNIKSSLLGILDATALIEHRGLNYLMGSDPKAVTVANFFKHYNPKLIGPSRGFHELRKFRGNVPNPYHNEVDQLNAAKSGAMAKDLTFELDYLSERLADPLLANSETKNDWKMITMHVGINDLCKSCKPEFSNITTSDIFESYVENAIQRIQRTFLPKTIVNLLGIFDVAQLKSVFSKEPSYCIKQLLLNPCSCLGSPTDLENVRKLSMEYDSKLQLIAKKYATKPGDTFGVMYTPMPIDFNSLPVHAFSNIDCFHPSVLGHEWIAKVLWNLLFSKLKFGPFSLKYDENEQIYCPTDSDRIQVLAS